MQDRSLIQARRRAAVDFLQRAVAGDIEAAYRQYVDMQGKHHNPFFPAGFSALKAAMIENHAQFPHKQLVVKHVLDDGDHVAVHSELVLVPGESRVAVVHLLRFEGDKIVEMWDVGEAVPADSPNLDGPF